MKTSDLDGAMLDYWVARALGISVSGHPPVLVCSVPYSIEADGGDTFRPSTNWGHGGPLIENEKITVVSGQVERRGSVGWLAVKGAEIAAWNGEGDIKGTAEAHGKTQLIAAMRCFCLAKFGEEVDDDPKIDAPGRPIHGMSVFS